MDNRQILSIPELAVVDREAELPDKSNPLIGLARCCEETQQDILSAGWIKEVKK